MRIAVDGRSGTHSEFIVGARGTNDCRSALTQVAYGVYRYDEQSDAGCVLTTRIILRREGAGLRFSERYTTRSGGKGSVEGVLTQAG